MTAVTPRREYTIALRIELKRKELKDDPVRTAELAAYFTHAKLQPVHQALSLRSAMSIFFKLKNFATCATFCRRLLELNPGAKARSQTLAPPCQLFYNCGLVRGTQGGRCMFAVPLNMRDRPALCSAIMAR